MEAIVVEVFEIYELSVGAVNEMLKEDAAEVFVIKVNLMSGS
ncbi:hypothetical protein [Zooshikella harenae]|nr:hypothetical protein [Zooshikella harenae]